jgi:dihydrofolate reductase
MDEPLAGRINIVITRKTDWKPKGAVVVNNWNDAVFVAQDADCKEVFVIGGGEIFNDTIKKADRIYMTRIHTIIDGDVFFPEINQNKWKLMSKRDCYADAKHKFDYSFEVWEKH